MGFERLPEGACDRVVRPERIRGAAQQGGVAGLETKPGSVGGDIWTRLIDDGNHAERHPDPLQPDSIDQRPATGDGPDRVRQPRYLPQTRSDAGHAVGRQRQPVEQSAPDSLGPRLRHIQLIGLEEGLDPRFQGRCHFEQRPVLRSRSDGGKDAGGVPRAGTHLIDHAGGV